MVEWKVVKNGELVHITKLKDVESKPMNAAKQNNTDGQNNPYPLAIVTMSQ